MPKVNLKDIFIIICISFLSSFILILFFHLFPPDIMEIHVPHGFNEIIERNYDSPIYVVLAKTLYNNNEIEKINFNKLSPSYYANHFPLLPLLVRMTTYITHNYFRSLILITWFSSALFTILLYLFLIKFKISQHPLLLASVSLFLPPRWLAVRTVGGTEPLFMLLMLLCLYFWFEKKYFITSLISIFLVLTRPPGFYVFFCFLGIILYEWYQEKFSLSSAIKILKSRFYIILMPLALIGLFYFYKIVFGDFWAYFKTSTGTNIHFRWIPFAPVLDYNSPVAEGFIYLLIIYSVGIYLLWRQKLKKLALFSLIYLLPNFFMSVDDIYRYLVPIAPFCIIIGFQKIINKKVFLYFFLFLLIGTYIYTLSLLPRRMFNYDDYAKLRMLYP